MSASEARLNSTLTDKCGASCLAVAICTTFRNFSPNGIIACRSSPKLCPTARRASSTVRLVWLRSRLLPARFWAPEIIDRFARFVRNSPIRPGPVSLKINHTHGWFCGAGGGVDAPLVRPLALLSMVLLPRPPAFGVRANLPRRFCLGRCLDTWQSRLISAPLVSVAASASSFVCSAALGTDEVWANPISKACQ